MIIQLQAPKDGVTDWVVNYLSKSLVALRRKHPEITKADVYLRKPTKLEKSCSVSLKVRGVSLVISRSANSFSKACYFVLADIEERLKLFFVKPVRKNKVA
jgi:ribosome-associated translation inhibitor RaiA